MSEDCGTITCKEFCNSDPGMKKIDEGDFKQYYTTMTYFYTTLAFFHIALCAVIAVFFMLAFYSRKKIALFRTLLLWLIMV